MELAPMINRCIRAASLDSGVFNEVEHDQRLTSEALTVVAIVSILGGLGAFLSALFSRGIFNAFASLAVTVILGLVGYFIWSFLCFFIGTRFMDGTATDVGELLRPLGYASAPQALALFGFIPCLGGIIALAGGIWSLVAGIVAVREALDFDTGRAVVTVVIGWVAVLIVSAVVGLIFGVGVAGMNAIGGIF
jgi:hypothetical protein